MAPLNCLWLLSTAALPVRHVLSTAVLAAPGVNIAGYRRADTPREAFMSMLDLGVRPLQQHTNQVKAGKDTLSTRKASRK